MAMTQKEMADMREIASTLTAEEVATCTDRRITKMTAMLSACHKKAQRAKMPEVAADFKHALDLFEAELSSRS